MGQYTADMYQRKDPCSKGVSPLETLLSSTGGVLPLRCLEPPLWLPLPVSGRVVDSPLVLLRQASPKQDESVYPILRQPQKVPPFHQRLGQLQDVPVPGLAIRTLDVLLRRNEEEQSP